MSLNLEVLDTEQVNKSSKNIDVMSTMEILQVINNEDKEVAFAVEKVLPSVEELVDEAHERMMNGGRVIYIGAGTSGRLGVLDASECPPTFGVDSTLIQGIIAGGFGALLKAKEGAEDDLTLARRDLIEIALNKNDTVIGLAASGRTPYVIGGLDYAKEIGAYTGAISCVHVTFHIHVTLRCSRCKYAGWTVARNSDCAACSFTAAHCQHDCLCLYNRIFILTAHTMNLFVFRNFQHHRIKLYLYIGIPQHFLKPLCVFGAGQLFFKIMQPEPVVNTLVEDSPQLFVAFQNQHAFRTVGVAFQCGCKSCGAAADYY